VPKRTGGYVPPALRGKQPAAGDTMPERSESPASGGGYRPPGARGQTTGGSSGGAYRPPGARRG
jgi:translation initiation factor 3 subunit A